MVPKELTARNDQGERVPLHGLWNRRHTTKFNGVSYPIQKAALAVFLPEGQAAVEANIAYYMENARIIREGLGAAGYAVHGGRQRALHLGPGAGGADLLGLLRQAAGEANVVGTPGSGFGSCGEGYFRLSAFGLRENVEEAVERIRTRL